MFPNKKARTVKNFAKKSNIFTIIASNVVWKKLNNLKRAINNDFLQSAS